MEDQHLELQNWTQTPVFASRVSEVQDKFRACNRVADFFNVPWLREAWEAATLGLFLQAQCIRLASQDEDANGGFDFSVITRSGIEKKFQTTLVVAEDGEMNSRWEENARTGKRTPSPLVTDEFAKSRIALSCQNKANEKYDGRGFHLLLNVNMTLADADAFRCKLPEAVSQAREAFKSIWVLDYPVVTRCWPHPWNLDTSGLRPRSVGFPMRKRIDAYWFNRELAAVLNENRRQTE